MKDEVDPDGSGQIYFPDFLTMMAKRNDEVDAE